MTKISGERRCRWCGSSIVPRPGRGRPRLYCRAGCRQQAHLARKLAEGHRLATDELVIRRADLEAIRDAVYGLQAALEDVSVDLADDGSPDGVMAALDHLRAEAEPVARLRLTPVVDRGPST